MECDGTATEPDQRAELRPRTGRTVSVGGNERVLLSSSVAKENRNQVQDLISV